MSLQKMPSYLTPILVFLPILNLVLNVISWLHLGIDLPYFDDWRAYYEGGIGSFDLAYLFQPANDTLYPVGLALDSLSYRLLDGSSIAYQFISMVSVLGLLLLLQWKLLLFTIEDKFFSAVAFCFTLFMLQPGSYWGLQNIAYHQSIPLVCGMAALYIALVSNRIGLGQVIALILLGLISGFSYISGAFLILVLGFVFLIISFRIQERQGEGLKKSGWVLIATAFLTVPAQLWVIIVVQHGTHLPTVPMAFPHEIDFWMYILGKIGRSLLLPEFHRLFSFIATCVVSLITVVLVSYLATEVCKKKLNFTLPATKTSIVFIALTGIIFVYLMLVGAGRTNLRPDSLNAPLDVFILGYARFHFFWVTLLWPWLVSAIITIGIRQHWWSKSRIQSMLVVIMPIFVMLIVFSTDAFRHKKYYQSVQTSRMDGEVRCLAVEMQKNGIINCPQLYPGDLSSRITFAAKTHASFIRYFPYIPISIGVDEPAPIFRFQNEMEKSVNIQNMNKLNNEKNEVGYRFLPEVDPQIHIKTDNEMIMRKCNHLEVNVMISIPESDIIQLYYVPIGESGFSEFNSKIISLQPNSDFKQVSFEIASASGFSDQIRLDPVQKTQIFTLKALEIRCRSSDE